MKKFKCVFVKYSRVLGLVKAPVMNIIEQTYHSETDSFRMEIPEGYELVSVSQTLPDIINKNKTDDN